MTDNQLIILIPLVAFFIYLDAYLKKRPAALFTIIGRSAAGLAYIYFFNLFCSSRGFSTGLGINPITIALSAFLGIPGAILAYGINLFRFFL